MSRSKGVESSYSFSNRNNASFIVTIQQANAAYVANGAAANWPRKFDVIVRDMTC
jgi:hypothetical protein